MIFNDREWLAISERLLKLTNERQLPWSGTPDQSETGEGIGMIFRTTIGDATYVIGSVDADGSFPYYMEIWQGQSAFDRMTSPASGRSTSDESAELRSTMRNLYRSAFRSFFGAAEKAERLIADLDALMD